MKNLQRLWLAVLFCSASAFAESQPPLELVEPGYGGGFTPGYGQNYAPYRYGPGYGRHYGWGTGPAYNRPYGGQGLRITREARDDGYLITIDHSRPGSTLQIIPQRGRLVVVSRYGASAGGPEIGYTRQWGSTSRTIGLPRDADLSRMEREEGEGRITLTIPRFRSWR